MTAFEEMGVLPEIGQAVDDMGWLLPTDVQAEAIPAILGGGDVLMAAETGSGKTGAFCLPIIQIVWETLKELETGRSQRKSSAGGGTNANSKVALSLFDRGQALAVSPDGLTCQSREQRAWHGTRSTIGVRNKGKYYYEGTVTDEGLCRLGWSTQSATLELGVDGEGFGFGGTGKKSFRRQFDDYGEAFGKHDVIGCLLDLDNFAIRFSKNGIDLGLAFDIPANLQRSSFFAAVVLKNAEIKFNFGNEPFKHAPGCGFIRIMEAPPGCQVPNAVTGSAAPPAVNVKNSTQAIIIEPSRELAEQTFNQVQMFKKCLKDPRIRELLLIGGTPIKEQMSAVQSGVDIIVATPGRLEDFISTGHLSLSGVRFFVLDEADGLLSQGYGKMINNMYQQIPKFTRDGKRLQMVICSATLHSFEVKKLAQSIMHFPTWIDLKGQDSVPETVHHVVCMINPNRDTKWTQLKRHISTDGVHYEDRTGPSVNSSESMSEAVKILKGEYVIQAIREHNMDQALIFCRTKLDCDNLEKYLNMNGGGAHARNNTFSCVCLHSDRAPPERKANLAKFKNGDVKFMICTDVAARGIDVTGVPYVINVTLPDDKANYIHRIGRVGRAERMGLAISLVSEIPEKVWYHSNCKNRGKNCFNTNLTDCGGCCIWYDEPKYLADIEEHLGVTIQQVGGDLKVVADEFDGKVTYGQKRKELGSGYENHVGELSNAVDQLSRLETEAQSLFLQRHVLHDKAWLASV